METLPRNNLLFGEYLCLPSVGGPKVGRRYLGRTGRALPRINKYGFRVAGVERGFVRQLTLSGGRGGAGTDNELKEVETRILNRRSTKNANGDAITEWIFKCTGAERVGDARDNACVYVYF